jgi:EmrB/QacA subfamily drug resistance transporter
VSAAAAFSRRDRTVLSLLCTVQFMIVLDGTIMNVAIPSIQHALTMTPQTLQWVINAYTVAFGGLLLLGGRAADLLGRRRVLIIGVMLFSLASLLGGLAQSGAVLIVARALQGLGAALAAPASMSFVAALFAAGVQRHRAFGAMGAIAALGAACGVLLGGVLTGYLGWQWVLLVNVPIGLAVMLCAARLLPQSIVDTQNARLDVLGALTVTGATVTAVFAVVGTTARSWSSLPTLSLLALSGALLAVFVAIERRAPQPLMPLALLRNRLLSAALVTALVHAAGPMATLYFLSLHLQQQLGYSALQTGFAFLPLAVAAGLGAAAASRLLGRWTPVPVMLFGLVVMAAGLASFVRLPIDAGYAVDVLPGVVVVGLGITLVGVPMTVASVSAMRSSDSGLASGLLNTSQQIGATLVLALLVAVASRAPQGDTFASARWVFAVASTVSIGGALVVALCWFARPAAAVEHLHIAAGEAATRRVD